MASEDKEGVTQLSFTEITLFGKKYTINYPTVGEMLAIENEKNRISEGRYSSYNSRFDDEGIIVKTMIDAMATFTVLIPQFGTDLNVKSWKELPMNQMAEIITQFTKIYSPWYTDWLVKLALFS